MSYPFGFGLSYTSFRIDDVEVSIVGSVAGGDLAVTVTASVANTGQRRAQKWSRSTSVTPRLRRRGRCES